MSSKDDFRIGVFVCRCGLNVAKSVDTTSLVEYSSKLSGVVYAEESEFACSEIGLKRISEAIRDNKINRVVIAGCSPWLHEQTFQRMMERVKLNRYLLEIANIREQVAFIYPNQILKATEKAKLIINAAVERVKTLEEIGKAKVPIQKSILVIGGGIAGVEAAKRLGDLGIEAYLIERTPFLGGHALQLGSVFSTEDCGTCVSPCDNELHRRCFYRNSITYHPYVNILTSTELKQLTGHIGDYKATLTMKPRGVNQELCMGCGKCEEVCPVEIPDSFNFGWSKRKAIYILSDQALPRIYSIDPGNCIKCNKCSDICPVKAIDLQEETREIAINVGAVIVTTGFESFNPKGLYSYGENPNVITQLQLARMLDMTGPTKGKVIRPSDEVEPKRIAMIQCVGSRDPKIHEYCSKICCGIAVKHATDIMERYPEAGIAIINKDIRLTGKHYEDYYYRAKDLGVRMLRGEVEQVVKTENNDIRLELKDEFGEHVHLYVDMVVLSTGLEPSKGTAELAEKLRIPLSMDGFFAERGPKLEPLDTVVDGIFIAGACHGPKDIQESLVQALGATGRVASLLVKGNMEIDLAKAWVDEEKCVGCGACASICPFKAIDWSAFGEPKIIEAACEGCGICAAVCPVSAMQLRHYKDDQLIPKIKAIMTPKWISEEKKDEPVIIAFACQWCSYAAADAAGNMGLEYPENIRIIRVPCTGRIDALHILSAFKNGADGVIISGCLPTQCNYLTGNLEAIDRVDIMKKTLDTLNISSDRLETIFTSACMPTWLVALFTDFTEKIKKMNETKKIKVELIP
ncbi:hydrogenase iron-sulfur subunit [Candidatus Bathyarchaeota archaeon]|nr:hydrogenase iron-sulfur subunit [Candidatus Bathyarchaeota archaeon]